MTDAPEVIPVQVGQVRADKYGARLVIHTLAPNARYVCSYPALKDTTTVLGARTIEDNYPNVIRP